MKKLIELFKIVGTSTVVGFFIIFFTRSNHMHCSALDAFIVESSIEVTINLIKVFFLIVLIWITGLIAYFFIKIKKQVNTFLYFSILTAIAFHFFIFKAITRQPEENRELKQEICRKSSDDGMMLNFKKLNKTEYDFINSKRKWLPTIPPESKSVEIEYYRDNFLGDYHLQIHLTLKEGEQLDTTKHKKWKLYEKRYYYEDSKN